MAADRVLHLEGGVYRYAAAGLPMTGDYDGSNAGRTPNVAQKPTGAGPGGPGGLVAGWLGGWAGRVAG